MGSLPTIKRVLADDFPTQETWIGTLLYPLNLLLNTIYSNLNNGLTLSQNCLAQVKTLAISGSSPSTSFLYPFGGVQAPVGVSIVQCLQADAPAAGFTAPVTCTWSYAAGVVSINSVTGLVAGHSYNCTFIVWGG